LLIESPIEDSYFELEMGSCKVLKTEQKIVCPFKDSRF
jgi:hypothetical protein